MRFLIVEDDLVSRRLLEKILGQYGPYDLATNGLEALELYQAQQEKGESYALICLDVMMPKLDGVRVLKAIRDYEEKFNLEADRKAKVILITALGESQIVRGAAEHGYDAYLPKPFDMDVLTDLLKAFKLLA